MKTNFKDKSVEKRYKVGEGGGFIKLKEGENKLRIVTAVEDFGQHYVKEEKKSYFCIGKDEGCPYCAKGDKVKVGFLTYVIDRETKEVKMWQFGYSIYSQISEFANNPEYAFDEIPGYDLTIKRTGEGLDTEYWVIPARQNTDLTDDEKMAVAAKTDKMPLEKFISKMKEKVTPVAHAGEPQEYDDEIKSEDIPF